MQLAGREIERVDCALPPERAQEEKAVAVVVPRGWPVACSANVDHMARNIPPPPPEAAVVEECRYDPFVHVLEPERWVVAAADNEGVAMCERSLKV